MVDKNTNNKNSNKNKKEPENKRKQYRELRLQSNYKTNSGHKLTPKEAKFIDLYIETGNQRQSVIDAGYTTKAPGQYAQSILTKSYIIEEIDYRLQKLEDEKIASAAEILKYFTGVMRGEIKDQFGLDAPLSERTKAAQELAKRKIDIAEKVNGNKEAGDGVITIKLDWSGITKQEKEDNNEDGEDDE